MRIVTILGARPQFIKAGTVSRAIAKYQQEGNDLTEIIVHTGQHYDANMSSIFFEEMHIPIPQYHLGFGGGTHGAMTGQMLQKIEEVLIFEKPDWVLVYGDTNSTLAGALAASKLNIPIAHVEAGLRSFNMQMPEEINRILTDRVSRILFCPTQQALTNLESEGFNNWKTDAEAIKSGDVMLDGALFYSQLSQQPDGFELNDFILCTVHMAENTDDRTRLESIFEALRKISQISPVVLPIHPRTRKKLQDFHIDTTGIYMIEPVGYLSMVWLLQNCNFVMTDSGGLQKEAYFFDKFCITLRDQTEWIELIDIGYNKLCGSDQDAILKAFNNFTSNSTLAKKVSLYGEGKAAELILDTLLNYNLDYKS